jgi:hypothetical protein
MDKWRAKDRFLDLVQYSVMSTNNGQSKIMDIRVVIPAKAGIHFDLDCRNMDSRFRGNDDRAPSRE